MQQYKLDYDTIYNGRGREIQEMIMNYFSDKNIQLISEYAEIPDRPDRDNVVGLNLDFVLVNGIEFGCGIGMGLNFLLKKVDDRKMLLSEGEYMTWDKVESIAFSLTNEVVMEKLEIFDSVIKKVREGEEIIKIDIER